VFAAQELYCAIKLNAEVIMCLSSAQSENFYQRVKQERASAGQAGAACRSSAGRMAKHKQEALVPTIDVRKAQATKKKDRVRILTEIAESIGIETFNAQLQAFMEAALQEEARAALLSAAAGSMHGGEGRVTLGMVHKKIKGLEQATRKQEQAMAAQLELEQAMAKQEHAMAKAIAQQQEAMAKQQGDVNALRAGVTALGEKLDAVLARL
jgi:hypothetical protein